MSTVTTGQVAKLIGYNRRTVLRKCELGLIPAVRIDERGHWRVCALWAQRVAERLGRPIPPARRGRSAAR